MNKNFFWLLVGSTLGAIICYIFLQYASIKIDSNLAVNIVIALAAIIAILLTLKQIDIQRQDRIWDMNKPILLEMMHLLTEVIEETENILDDRYSVLSNPNQETPARQPNPKVYDNLNRIINNILSVYKPIINDDLIQKLNNYKKIDSNLTAQFNNDDFDEFDPTRGYEQQLVKSKELYKSLSDFIKKIAGV